MGIERPNTAEIIHISDVHFGDNNIANTNGPAATKRDLAELLLRDLLRPGDLQPRVAGDRIEKTPLSYERVICITGDFGTKGSGSEFESARQFLETLSAGLGWTKEVARERIVLIPGNHDLEWNEKDSRVRWRNWRDFYDRFYGKMSEPSDPLACVRLHRVPSANVALLCLDSSHHIYAESPYRNCGSVEEAQMDKAEQLLETASKEAWFEKAIKIVLIHHHPVLIPSLVEKGRGAGRQDAKEPGYDAVFNAQRILNTMHRFGFHALLHGHKHIPHVFTEDITNACHLTEDHSSVIIAGGTLSSSDRIDIAGWRQCFNKIIIHWNAQRSSARVQVTTRGLERFDDRNQELSWQSWKWRTMRVVDRFSTAWQTAPSPNLDKLIADPPYHYNDDLELRRTAEYDRLRRNMVVVEARPSLLPGQAYEMRFWITAHESKRLKPRELPIKVVWSAGPLFPKKTIYARDDSKFCGVFHCYAPMLIQAELYFEDGTSQLACIYGRIPEPPTTKHL